MILLNYKRFILWEAVPGDDGRVEKRPISPHSLNLCNPLDPAAWVSYDEALQAYRQHSGRYGVAFVFTADLGLYFVDVDHCLTPEGAWSERAQEVYSLLPHAYIEVSTSGDGLHFMGRGVCTDDRRCRSKDDTIELYTKGRFCALTFDSRGLGGTGEADNSEALAYLVGKHLQREVNHDGKDAEWRETPVPSWHGPSDDTELIRLAKKARSNAAAFGGRATFAQLHNADEAKLAEHFPSSTPHKPYNASSADAAYFAHLAYWTGKDCARMERIARTSGLVRAKWDDRPEYIPDTILGACTIVDKVCGHTDVTEAPPPPMAGEPVTYPGSTPESDWASLVQVRHGAQILPPEMQDEYFRGCVYVTRLNRVMTPNGELLKEAQFNALYGGYQFTIQEGGKTTDKPFRALTNSQVRSYPNVDMVASKPLKPAGAVYSEGGRSYINTWVPRWGARVPGDASPFLAHIARMVPYAGDREIVLDYLAALVQYAGTKFSWALFMQGAEGNGKSIIKAALKHAVGRDYMQEISTTDIGNKFNAWAMGSLIGCIEEANMRGNYDLANTIKPLVTNPDLPIQGKGKDQITAEVCINLLIYSNLKDGIIKARNDRRYAVIYTAQQRVEDLYSSGMTDAYFDALWGWMDGGGREIVADYLWTRQITHNLRGRAPRTSCQDEAIYESMGDAERALTDAMSEGGVPGIQSDILSSVAAQGYLQGLGLNIQTRRFARVLANMGLVPHPLHPRVRAGNDSRIRIYCVQGSPAERLDKDQVLQTLKIN